MVAVPRKEPLIALHKETFDLVCTPREEPLTKGAARKGRGMGRPTFMEFFSGTVRGGS